MTVCFTFCLGKLAFWIVLHRPGNEFTLRFYRPKTPLFAAELNTDPAGINNIMPSAGSGHEGSRS